MNKDLQNMDDLFNSAYRRFEEDPSADTWGKINARLTINDAASYKRKFIGWKRAALLLLFLLTGFVLYELGILKKGSGYSNENDALTIETKKTNKPALPAGKNEPGTITKQEVDADFIIANPAAAKKSRDKKIADQNTRLSDETIKIAVTVPATYKKSSEEKINRTLFIEQGSCEKMIARLRNDIPRSHLPFIIINKSPLIQSIAKSASPQKRGPFTAYWTITGYVSEERANYRLDNDQPTIEKIKQRENHEPSFSGGMLITRQVRKQWGLQTGLIYSNTAIGISPQKIYALRDQAGNVLYKYITSSGYAYIKPGFGSPPAPGDSLTTADAQHSLHHIIVPLIIKFTIARNNKLSFTPGIGIAGNFLTSAKIETEIEDASNRENVFINKLNGVRPFYWSIMADAEVQYELNKNTSVNIRPSFRYAISPITKNNDVDTYPYSFGLGIGVTYKF